MRSQLTSKFDPAFGTESVKDVFFQMPGQT